MRDGPGAGSWAAVIVAFTGPAIVIRPRGARRTHAVSPPVRVRGRRDWTSRADVPPGRSARGRVYARARTALERNDYRQVIVGSFRGCRRMRRAGRPSALTRKRDVSARLIIWAGFRWTYVRRSWTAPG